MGRQFHVHGGAPMIGHFAAMPQSSSMSANVSDINRMPGYSPPPRMRPAMPTASSMSPISPSIPQPNRYVPCGGRYEVSCGVVELPGSRNAMEDRTTSMITGQTAFFGVYDGHGGSAAAEYCQDNLHKHLHKAMSMQWRE